MVEPVKEDEELTKDQPEIEEVKLEEMMLFESEVAFEVVTNEEAAQAKIDALPEEERKRREEIAKSLAGRS